MQLAVRLAGEQGRQQLRRVGVAHPLHRIALPFQREPGLAGPQQRGVGTALDDQRTRFAPDTAVQGRGSGQKLDRLVQPAIVRRVVAQGVAAFGLDDRVGMGDGQCQHGVDSPPAPFVVGVIVARHGAQIGQAGTL